MNRNKISILIAVCLSAIIATIIGCSREDGGFPLTGMLDSHTIEELKNTLPSEICVFDPSQYFPAETKSAAGTPIIIDNEHLDYEQAKTYENDKNDYIQIPFHAESPFSNIITYLPEFKEGMINPTNTAGKTFLIIQTSKDSLRQEKKNIVSILPHPNYMSGGELDSLDFFYDGFFNAVFFYSNLEGKLLKTEVYYCGRLRYIGGINMNQTISNDSLVAIISPQTMLTKTSIAPDEGAEEIEGIEVYARPDFDSYWENLPGADIDQEMDFINSDIDVCDPPRGGGGGSVPIVTVNWTVEGEGSIENSQSTYKYFETIDVTAIPRKIGEGSDAHVVSEFIHWSGKIPYSNNDPNLVLKLPTIMGDDLTITANFHDYKPCTSEGRANPLVDMKIQYSGDGNILGGTYGFTRDGGKTNHPGMDFAGPIGTPVFATHDGIVIIARNDFDDFEILDDYKQKGGKWVDKFTGGNAISIKGSINGSVIITGYRHLSDVLVSGNQKVKAGDIIGTIGMTGNSNDLPKGNAHLHYQVNVDGKPVNPIDYIYSKFNKNWELTNPCKQ